MNDTLPLGGGGATVWRCVAALGCGAALYRAVKLTARTELMRRLGYYVLEDDPRIAQSVRDYVREIETDGEPEGLPALVEEFDYDAEIFSSQRSRRPSARDIETRDGEEVEDVTKDYYNKGKRRRSSHKSPGLSALILGNGSMRFAGDRACEFAKCNPEFSRVIAMEEESALGAVKTRMNGLEERVWHIRPAARRSSGWWDLAAPAVNATPSFSSEAALNANDERGFHVAIVTFEIPPNLRSRRWGWIFNGLLRGKWSYATNDERYEETYILGVLEELKRALIPGGLLVVEAAPRLVPHLLDGFQRLKLGSFESITIHEERANEMEDREILAIRGALSRGEPSLAVVETLWSRLEERARSRVNAAEETAVILTARRRRPLLRHRTRALSMDTRPESHPRSRSMRTDSCFVTPVPPPRLVGKDGYRMRVGCVCVSEAETSQLLVVSSARTSNRWIIPGGGLEAGEDPLMGAMREVMEESGASGRVVCEVGLFVDEAKRTKTRIYLMLVGSLADDFAECRTRKRKWIDIRRFIASHADYSTWVGNAVKETMRVLQERGMFW